MDAIVTDDILLQWMQANNPDLIVPGKLYTIEPYGMGLRENDSDWRDYVNNVISRVVGDEEIPRHLEKMVRNEPGLQLAVVPEINAR